jgi:surface protein
MSTVTNPANMFQGGTSNPTGLEGWDTSEMITMESMFASNSGFNRDITAWNTSKVTTFQNFMANTNAFSGWDLSTKVINPGTPDEYVAWDVSSCTQFKTMFTGTAAPSSCRNWRFLAASGSFASPFLQQNSAFDADVSEWEMPPVAFATNNMFKFAPAFTGGDMKTKVVNPGTPDQYTAWDMTLNTSLSEMFSQNSNGVFNGDISNWNTGNVTSMSQCFVRCILFNSDISGWNTSQVTLMNTMFQSCTSFDRDISGWNVGLVTNMNSMFSGASAMSYDLSTWNMSSVTTMTQWCGGSMDFNYGAWNLASIVTIGGFGILSNANCANTMIGWAGNATTNTGATATGIFLNSRVLSKTATVGVDGYDGQDAYNGWLKLIAPTPNANRTTGTNTSTGTDLLIDSGATFTASVNEGDVVANTTAGTYSTVVSVDSDIQLTLEDDIFTSTSQAYSVDGGFGWVLTGVTFT